MGQAFHIPYSISYTTLPEVVPIQLYCFHVLPTIFVKWKQKPTYLYIGVERPKLDPFDLRFHHSLDCVASPTANTDHLCGEKHVPFVTLAGVTVAPSGGPSSIRTTSCPWGSWIRDCKRCSMNETAIHILLNRNRCAMNLFMPNRWRSGPGWLLGRPTNEAFQYY